MQIKGMDGQSYNVTGQGQGNFNTVGAAAGIASFLGINAGNVLGGGCGNRGAWVGNGCMGGCSENTLVTRYEAGLSSTIAAKDARIGLLESQVYTDQKLVEVVKDYTTQIKELAAEVRANKDAQVAINMQQAVYNGTNNAAMQCIQGQVAQLFSLTKLVVPNASVCPGWGPVCVQPAECPTK
jgi:hypothetical protein